MYSLVLQGLAHLAGGQQGPLPVLARFPDLLHFLQHLAQGEVGHVAQEVEETLLVALQPTVLANSLDEALGNDALGLG